MIRNVTSLQIFNLLKADDTIKWARIPADPTMHQKNGNIMVPVSVDVLKQILLNVHDSARYDFRVEDWYEEKTIVVYGGNKSPRSGH